MAVVWTRFLTVVVLLTSVAAYAQDLTIISKETRDGGRPETVTNYISADHVRMSHGSGKEAILDFKSGQMTTLDTNKKTYYVTTRADMDALVARMQEQMNSPQMQRMREQMKALPPEQRAKMGAATDGLFTVHDVGTTRKIAGYTCENWKIDLGGYSRIESCLSSELKYPAQAFEMYRHFSDSMKNMAGAFGPIGDSAAKMQEQFKKMTGYPMANTTTTDVMGHKSVIVSEVVAVQHGTIAASVWQVPPGYRSIDNPMLKAFQARSKR